MEFLLHNEEGIAFPALRPAYDEGELFFERFRALIPRDGRDSIIGEGGTGLIHLVRDELMDRVVALKLPHENVLRDPSARYDVIRETRQAIELTHPHIVRIHDFHEGREGWGISMQHVRGKNLDEWRHQIRGLRNSPVAYHVEQIEIWISQLCDALIYAHEDAHMVHRDIKPKNLMLERHEDGREKLLLTDFGITQKLRMHTMMLSRIQPDTSDKATMGTLPYMSWDQVQGAPASTLDDVYAVGATIYELLTSRPPFYEGGYEQIRVQVEQMVPPPMARRLRDFDLPDHGIPDAWEETVAACLAKRPEDRPQSIREVAARLGLSSSPVPVAVSAAPSGEIASLQAGLDQRDRELQALRGQLEKTREETLSLQNRLEEAHQTFEQQRAALEGELAGARETLAAQPDPNEIEARHQAEIASLQQAVAGAEEIAAGRQVEISSLQQVVAGAEEIAAGRQSEIVSLQQAVSGAQEDATREKAEAAARMEELQRALDERIAQVEEDARRRIEEAGNAAAETARTARKQSAHAVAEALARAEIVQRRLQVLESAATASPAVPESPLDARGEGR